MPKRREHGQGGLFRNPTSKMWRAKWYGPDGRPHECSTRTPVKAEAEKILNTLRSDTDKGLTPFPDLRRITYGELRGALLDSYRNKGHKSLRTMADGTETLCPLPALDEFFGYPDKEGPSFPQITSATVQRFIDKRRADGVGSAAINNSLSLLRRMLNLAKKQGRVQFVPHIELLKPPPARKGFVKQPEFEKLLAVLAKHLRPLVVFLYYCGGRLGEALALEWSQVDLKAATVTFNPEQTKTDEARTVPIPDRLIELLRPGARKDGRVFDATNLTKLWRAACVKVGLGTLIPVEGKTYTHKYRGLRLHDLRRSALNNLRKAGVSQAVAMRFSGHKTISTFLRYNIVDTDEMFDALRKVEAAPPRALRANGSRRKKLLPDRVLVRREIV